MKRLSALTLGIIFGIFYSGVLRAETAPTAPMPVIVMGTTDTIAVKEGEATTTTAPSFSIAYVDAQSLSMNPNPSNGSFTTSLAVALASPSQGKRLISAMTICNRDTVSHTIYVNIAPSGTPSSVTAAIFAGYTLTAGSTMTFSPAGTVMSTALTFPLSVANGGTGTNTLAAGAFLTGNGTSAVTLVGPGAAGTIPISNGSAPVMIAPSGDVTINSTGVTAIGNLKVTNAMLAGSITAAKLVGSDITTVGTITVGTWNGTAIAGPNGGTGQTTYTIGDLLSASSSSALSRLADVAAGSYLRSGGVGVQAVWSTLILPNAATQGDVIVGTSANTLGSVSDVATGSALISGGVGAVPSFGKIGLTTHVSGTLPIANGGTNSTTALTNNQLMYSNAGTIGELGAMTDGQIVVGKAASAPQIVTPSGDWTITNAGVNTIGAAKVTTSKLSSDVRPNLNYLINGGFEVKQRTAATADAVFTAGLSVVLGTDKYSSDRWKCAGANADVAFKRVDTNGALESGLNSRYYGVFEKITNTGKMMAYQVIESANTFPLASRTITFQCKIKATLTSANKKIRLGILQNNSTATIDLIAASTVPATWGAASTDPTLATTFSYVTSGIAVPTGAQGTANGNAVDCTTTTSWQQFAVSVTAPTNAKNLIAALWTDDTMTALDVVNMSEAQLIDGGSIRDYVPQANEVEIAKSQRYFYSCGLETAGERICPGECLSTTIAQVNLAFPVSMRIAPSLVSISDHTKFGVFGSSGSVVALAVGGLALNSFTTRNAHIACTVAAGLTAGNATFLVKNTDTTVPLQFEADF